MIQSFWKGYIFKSIVRTRIKDVWKESQSHQFCIVYCLCTPTTAILSRAQRTHQCCSADNWQDCATKCMEWARLSSGPVSGHILNICRGCINLASLWFFSYIFRVCARNTFENKAFSKWINYASPVYIRLELCHVLSIASFSLINC